MPGQRRAPFFSILVTAYNRPQPAARCVRSCLGQAFEDFEVVVVDDGSTDATVSTLQAFDDPRLRVVRHDRNRGISPARATAVEHARGEWFVIVDSDDELVPHALSRFRVLIEDRPEGVSIIRSRLRLDNGSINPEIMPHSQVTGYRERLLWLEAVISAGVGSDAGHCLHRSVFEEANFFADRRGAMEGLWELDAARRAKSLWVSDILGLVHNDADNSYTRDADVSRLRASLQLEAPDMLWMFETMIERHGPELARLAPTLRWGLDQGAALQAFMIGDRRTGIRHTKAAIRRGGGVPRTWGNLVFGLVGPRALAYAKLIGRRTGASRR